MANEQNLLKGEDIHKLTVEEQTRGGIASGEARRRKRDLRLALETLLEKGMKTKSGEEVSGAEALAIELMSIALKGKNESAQVRAFESIRATTGQDPVQKIQVAEVDEATIKEIEGIIDEIEEANS